ncbi:hypothetical protein [Yinghuangia sp. YIM S09857]|uniref:hypothetical protein n=1 Tax=Yinghuangia sp. YIM S09857 TaxID=3436929 RepID=UPI003F5332C8
MFLGSLMIAAIFGVYFVMALGLARSVIRRHLLRAHLRRDGVNADAVVTAKTGLATYVRFDLPSGDRVDAKIPVVLDTPVAGRVNVVHSPGAPARVLAADGLRGRQTWLVRRTAIVLLLLVAGIGGVVTVPWDWG